ncbi:MAG: hypothetical protein ACT4PU_12345 [Planctomycetota bacterium]
MKRSGTGSRRCTLVALALAALLTSSAGCAFTNRDNRPVWNAFEENLVPEGGTAFWATLPLTFPGGLVCILVDSFIVHPAQVVDDSFDDTVELWDDVPWEKEYYTQLAVVPFRAIGTPIFFVLDFLGRCFFDLPEHRTEAELAEHRARSAEQQQESVALRLETWLNHLGSGGKQGLPYPRPGEKESVDAVLWASLRGDYAFALANATAAGRLELHRGLRTWQLPPWLADPLAGLRDRDPVVRFILLGELPTTVDVPPELRAALLADENEMVRLRAAERWPVGS